jgi:DNA-binding NarL/FixJ family response regulator
MPTRIVLVDAHRMFRESLRLILARHEDFTVVGDAGNADDARRVIAASAPDVVLLGLVLSGANGVDLVRDLATRRSPRILVVSMHSPSDFAGDVLNAGGAGYVNKAQSVAELLRAIRTVADGEVYLPGGATALAHHGGRGREAPLKRLSRREREVFERVVEGCSNKETASVLRVSIKTVETHRANINRKLGVHSTGQLVRYAATHGFLAAQPATR